MRPMLNAPCALVSPLPPRSAQYLWGANRTGSHWHSHWPCRCRRPISPADPRQQAAVGETPNLAARLQSLAGPNQVVIDAATRRQIGGLFECQDLGTVELKGLPDPVPAWQVLSVNRALGQFEALRSGATPLVGRDEEMELLLRRWAQAKAGNGRVVLISAEPGVGKSRLAEALVERIAADPHTRLRYFCSPHHQDSALYPVIAQMERAAGFARRRARVRLAKLQALLAATCRHGGRGADRGSALVPSADLAPLLDITPQRKKDKTFEALLRHVEGLARQQPVLMVFDDLHWIDPSSRELLDRVIEQVADWPVLLLAMFRPEFQPPWIGQPHVTMLTLATARPTQHGGNDCQCRQGMLRCHRRSWRDRRAHRRRAAVR